jgi:hypothetical protein
MNNGVLGLKVNSSLAKFILKSRNKVGEEEENEQFPHRAKCEYRCLERQRGFQ